MLRKYAFLRWPTLAPVLRNVDHEPRVLDPHIGRDIHEGWLIRLGENRIAACLLLSGIPTTLLQLLFVQIRCVSRLTFSEIVSSTPTVRALKNSPTRNFGKMIFREWIYPGQRLGQSHTVLAMSGLLVLARFVLLDQFPVVAVGQFRSCHTPPSWYTTPKSANRLSLKSRLSQSRILRQACASTAGASPLGRGPRWPG